MLRTTIMIPADLKHRAEQQARRSGVSLGEFVREALRAAVSERDDGTPEDPLFADTAVYDGESPSDSARNHDRYLYGETK